MALNWRKCAPDCMQQASPVACLQGQVYLCIHASKINVTLTRAQRCLTVNSDGDFFKKDAVSRRWCEDPQNDVEAFPVLRNQPPAPALGKTSGAVSTARHCSKFHMMATKIPPLNLRECEVPSPSPETTALKGRLKSKKEVKKTKEHADALRIDDFDVTYGGGEARSGGNH